jgi:hypothetical protein
MGEADQTRSRPALEVPLSTVPTRGSRRALVAALTICAVLGGSVGLSVLAGQPATSGPNPSAVALAPSVASPPAETAPPTETPVAEQLPQVRSVALERAPGLGFVRREGDDLALLAWHPNGQGLVTAAHMPGAYASFGTDTDPFPSISRDGALILLRVPDEGQEVIRIVSRKGIVWERRGVASTGIALWAENKNQLVVPLDEGGWLAIDLEGPKPTVHSIKVEGVNPPGPPPGLGFSPRPIAFSADSRWVYGEAAATVDPRNRTLFRAPTMGGRTTRLQRLPMDGPARAISEVNDPATGRRVDETGFPNGTISSLVVRNPDGSRAWEVRFPAIVNSAWIGDGRLAVMHSNQIEGPRYFSLVVLSSEGDMKLSLLEAGPLSGAGIFGVRKGYIVAGYLASPSRELLLVMIDPDDGRAGALALDGEEFDSLRLGGWLE